MLPNDVRTVYMPTCVNATSEPLIEMDVTRAILAQIQMDGSLRIASEDTADTVLDVKLTGFDLDPVGYVSGDSSTVPYTESTELAPMPTMKLPVFFSATS